MSSGRSSGSIVVPPPIADGRHHSRSMFQINLIRNVTDRQFSINALHSCDWPIGGFYRGVRIPNLCRGLHLGGAFGPDLSPARPRRTLFRLMEARRPIGEIAERLGRHPSTIYRELGRNRFRDGDRGFCGYFPLNAQDLARGRRQRRRKLAADDALRAHVVGRLRDGWSPQQIAGRLKQEQGRASVCHETIYRHVYGPEGREDGLYRHLPKARRRRGSRYGRRPRSAAIPRERWIENRPVEVQNRESFGHWEADLLIFRKELGKANVPSLIERKSRFPFLLPNEDKRSAAVTAGIAAVPRPLPEDARRTVTFDRGTE